MAYEVVMPYHLHMPSYFLETFTEYPQLSGRIPQDNQMAQLIIGCAFLLLSLHDCDKKKSATYISDCALYKS